MWIAEVSIKRPVFAVMLIATLVGLGWLSFGRIGVDSVSYTHLTLPTIYSV